MLSNTTVENCTMLGNSICGGKLGQRSVNHWPLTFMVSRWNVDELHAPPHHVSGKTKFIITKIPNYYRTKVTWNMCLPCEVWSSLFWQAILVVTINIKENLLLQSANFQAVRRGNPEDSYSEKLYRELIARKLFLFIWATGQEPIAGNFQEMFFFIFYLHFRKVHWWEQNWLLIVPQSEFQDIHVYTHIFNALQISHEITCQT